MSEDYDAGYENGEEAASEKAAEELQGLEAKIERATEYLERNKLDCASCDLALRALES